MSWRGSDGTTIEPAGTARVDQTDAHPGFRLGALYHRIASSLPASSSSEEDVSVACLLDWKRYRTNPFEEEWPSIVSCVRAHPDLTAASLFRQLQSCSPGRYHPGQLRCLQRGVRCIRTRLRALNSEPEASELIHGDLPQPLPEPIVPSPLSLFPPLPQDPSPSVAGEAAACGTTAPSGTPAPRRRGAKQPNITPITCSASITSPGYDEAADTAFADQATPPVEEGTLAHAIQAYLQEQVEAGHRPKTLQWHQTALGQLRAYLLTHRQSQGLDTLTDTVVQEWLTFLQTTPTSTGALRSSMTIATYARSVRAFGNWLVRTGRQAHALFSSQRCPIPGPKQMQLVEPEAFAQLLEACQRSSDGGAPAEKMAARNRALLWLLWDGGIRVAELCALRRNDVFPHQGIVRIKGSGAKERRIALGREGQQALRAYLELTCGDRQEHNDEEALFQTDTGIPLTINGLQSLFVRLNQRLNLPGTHISPSMLRDTFAVRSLRAGDSPEAVQKLLGLAEKSAVKRYQEEARSLAKAGPSTRLTQRFSDVSLAWS